MADSTTKAIERFRKAKQTQADAKSKFEDAKAAQDEAAPNDKASYTDQVKAADATVKQTQLDFNKAKKDLDDTITTTTATVKETEKRLEEAKKELEAAKDAQSRAAPNDQASADRSDAADAKVKKAQAEVDVAKRELIALQTADEDMNTGLDWPPYSGTFDVWTLIKETRSSLGYKAFLDEAYSLLSKPLEDDGDDIYIAFKEILTERIAPDENAMSEGTELEPSLDCLKYAEMKSVKFSELFDETKFAQATVYQEDLKQELTEKVRSINEGTVTGHHNLKDLLSKCIEEDDDNESPPPIGQTINDVFTLRLAGEFDHIKKFHTKMTEKMVALHKLCQAANPSQNSALDTLIREIITANDEIQVENKKWGLPEILGLIPVDNLKTWYLSRSESVDSLKDLWLVWVNHQIPLGYLRKRSYAVPAFEGTYPKKDNVAAYRKMVSGIDIFQQTTLDAAARQRERDLVFNSRFEAEFLDLIYPPSTFKQRPRKTPDPREFIHNNVIVKQETHRIPFGMPSYGMSTEQFEPGYTLFGGRIVAVNMKDLHKSRQGSRVFIVETANRVYKVFHQNEVGGTRIYRMCQDLVGVLPITAKGDPELPATGDDLQAYGWGVDVAAFRGQINTPLNAQPLCYVILWYRKEVGGQQIRLAMSRATLASLIGKAITDSYIAACITDPSHSLERTLFSTMQKRHPALRLRGSQRVEQSQVTPQSDQLGSIANGLRDLSLTGPQQHTNQQQTSTPDAVVSADAAGLVASRPTEAATATTENPTGQ